MENKTINKLERMKFVIAGGILGYIVGIFTPVAVVGAGISMVSGIVLFGAFLYYCKLMADEHERRDTTDDE